MHLSARSTWVAHEPTPRCGAHTAALTSLMSYLNNCQQKLPLFQWWWIQ